MNTNTRPYFYIIRHVSSNMYYAGCKFAKGCDPDNFLTDNGYKTSSPTIKKLISRDGLSSIEVIVCIDDTFLGDVYDFETTFLTDHDCANNPNWINIHNNDRIYPSFGTEKFRKLMMVKHNYPHNSYCKEVIIKRAKTYEFKTGYKHWSIDPKIKNQKKEARSTSYERQIVKDIQQYISDNNIKKAYEIMGVHPDWKVVDTKILNEGLDELIKYVQSPQDFAYSSRSINRINLLKTKKSKYMSRSIVDDIRCLIHQHQITNPHEIMGTRHHWYREPTQKLVNGYGVLVKYVDELMTVNYQVVAEKHSNTISYKRTRPQVNEMYQLIKLYNIKNVHKIFDTNRSWWCLCDDEIGQCYDKLKDFINQNNIKPIYKKQNITKYNLKSRPIVFEISQLIKKHRIKKPYIIMNTQKMWYYADQNVLESGRVKLNDFINNNSDIKLYDVISRRKQTTNEYYTRPIVLEIKSVIAQHKLKYINNILGSNNWYFESDDFLIIGLEKLKKYIDNPDKPLSEYKPVHMIKFDDDNEIKRNRDIVLDIRKIVNKYKIRFVWKILNTKSQWYYDSDDNLIRGLSLLNNYVIANYLEQGV